MSADRHPAVDASATSLLSTATHPVGRVAWSSTRFRVVVIVLGVLAFLLTGIGVGAAHAAPADPATDTACQQKAPAAVAWCMPWAVRVATPPTGSTSHWVTHCSKATTDADRQSCATASLTLDQPTPDGTASVLMDGPTDAKGTAGLINCDLIGAQSRQDGNPARRASWQAKQARCYTEATTWAAAAYDPNPAKPGCDLTDVACRVREGAKDAASAGIRSGIQGLVDAIVQAEVFLLSKLATAVFTSTSIASPDQAFYGVYNSLAGTLVLLIFVFFILSTIINGLRTGGGPSPIATLGGLVRAVLGITFAGGIAYTIVLVWDQATAAAIDANARKPWDPSRPVTALTNLTDGVATLILAALFGLLGIVGLVLLFIIMLFRGLLATGAALFGAMAMTGQVMPETRHWGRRWFWTVNALGSSKFFIAQLWIYGGRSAYESDDLMTVLQSILLIWLMVAAPFILLRLTSMWDGYLSDVNAHGLLAAAGGPLQIGSSFADGLSQGASGSGGGSSGDSDSATGLMESNSASMPTTPADAVGQLSGIEDGPGREASQAAATGEDGERVGTPATDPNAEDADGVGGDGGGAEQGPNAQEADGVQAGTGSAQHDLATGELTAPGDSTGDGASLPMTPQATEGADPTATGLTSADGLMPGAADAGDPSGDQTGGAPAGGAAPGPEPAGAPSAAPNPAPDPAGSEASDDASPPSGQPGGGAATAGGSQGAAAVADAPIVPL
jgi:hypothetical protein